MAIRGSRFLNCPDCGKRGVSIRFGRHGDDGYGCRYCDFWAYTGGSYHLDELNRDRLRTANPERTEDVA